MLNRVRTDEKGATAVLVAASMVLIMGMAALVVDYGLALSERRLDQNVADAAVMGGAIQTIQTANPANGVTEVKRLVDVNLGRIVDDTAWQACVDPDQLAFLPDPGNECISWETGFQTLVFRVRVPGQVTETTFGKILGVDTLTTDAFAEATLEANPGGKLLPFSLFADAGGTGTEQCLKSSASGQNIPAPCDDLTATGQFGGFDPYKYTPGTDFCKTNTGVFVYSLALGIDHPMSSFEPDYSPGDFESFEGGGCPSGPPSPVPNTVGTLTGNKVPFIANGLIKGDTQAGVTFSGRLRQSGTGAFLQIGNGPSNRFEVNDEPIWSFFKTGYCTAATSALDPVVAKTEALNCLKVWNFGINGAIFTTGFKNATRVAFVPIYDEPHNPPLPPSQPRHINRLLPIYLETVFLKNPSAPLGYEWHSPGNTGTFSGNSPNSFTALTSIVLDCDMMIDQPCDPETSPGEAFAADLSTLLLSR